MKKWQLGICITCAAVLAGMFLFNNVAQAAGVVRPDATDSGSAQGQVTALDVLPAQAMNCLWQQPVMNRLLARIEAEAREEGARMVKEAAAALQQGAIVIALPAYTAPRAQTQIAPALVTAE